MSLGVAVGGLAFQSTLPRGERRTVVYSLFSDILFQSTLPRGERPTPKSKQMVWRVFQSTLPRGERLSCGFADVVNRFVSIHAPAWGATFE